MIATFITSRRNQQRHTGATTTSFWLGAWQITASFWIVSSSFFLLVGAQSLSAQQQACQTETMALNTNANIQQFYAQSSLQPNCTSSGNDTFCSVDFASVTANFEPYCVSQGGSFVVYDETTTCDFAATGGRLISSAIHGGSCAGPSCSQSIIESLFQLGQFNLSQALAGSGLTNCVFSYGSLSFNTTSSTGGGSSPTGGGSSPTGGGSSSTGGGSSSTSGGSSSATALQTCISETTTLLNTLPFSNELYSYNPNCQTIGSYITCITDYSGYTSADAGACSSLGGKFYKVNEYYTCDYQNSNGLYYLKGSILEVGVCFGASCPKSYIDSTFQDALANVTVEWEAQGYYNCNSSSTSATLLSGGNSVSGASMLVDAITSSLLALVFAFMGHQLIVMACA